MSGSVVTESPPLRDRNSFLSRLLNIEWHDAGHTAVEGAAGADGAIGSSKSPALKPEPPK
jgi:hypothetical protein